MAGIQLDPFKIIWLQRLFVFKFPAYPDRELNFVFKTVELRFVCNNHPFQSSLLFLSLNRRIFSVLSSFCFLNGNLHLACGCVGIMLQATAGWEAVFSRICPSEYPCHYLGDVCCYALYYYHLPSRAWEPSEDLIAPSGLCLWGCYLWQSLNLKVSKVSFIANKHVQQILTPATSIMCLKGPPLYPCSAVCSSSRRLLLQQRSLVAIKQQPHSSLRACSSWCIMGTKVPDGQGPRSLWC